MKTIVLYSSTTGFTKKYAKWIGSELKVEALQFTLNYLDNLKNYDLIIYGGNITANKIKYIKAIKTLDHSKLVVFGVGLNDDNDKTLDLIKKANHLEDIPTFYFRGGTKYKELNPISRFILKKVSKIDKDVDYSNKESINELVDYVKKIGK